MLFSKTAETYHKYQVASLQKRHKKHTRTYKNLNYTKLSISTNFMNKLSQFQIEIHFAIVTERPGAATNRFRIYNITKGIKPVTRVMRLRQMFWNILLKDYHRFVIYPCFLLNNSYNCHNGLLHSHASDGLEKSLFKDRFNVTAPDLSPVMSVFRPIGL